MKKLTITIILLLLAVPAFSGVYLESNWARIVYLAIISGAVFILRGRFLWLTANTIAVVIIVPVILGGFILGLVILLAGFGSMHFNELIAHYTWLGVNMLTVIPLGIALVSLVPTAKIETRLLQNTAGVSKLEKVLLMAMRVFNHVLFAVMPEIVQAAFEEMRFNGYVYKTTKHGKRRRIFFNSIIYLLTFVAITALCNSLKYLHFWAAEISNLPNRNEKNLNK